MTLQGRAHLAAVARRPPPGPTNQSHISKAVHNRPTEEIYIVDLSRFDPTTTIHHFSLYIEGPGPLGETLIHISH